MQSIAWKAALDLLSGALLSLFLGERRLKPCLKRGMEKKLSVLLRKALTNAIACGTIGHTEELRLVGPL